MMPKWRAFGFFAPSSLLWAGWGIIVPFYTVQDCSLVGVNGVLATCTSKLSKSHLGLYSTHTFNLCQNNWLVFVVFQIISSQGDEIIWFLLFKLVFTCVFCHYFLVFSQSKRMENLLYSVSFCSLKLIRIQFLWLLSHGKEKIISCFLISFTHQVGFFLLQVLIFWPFIYSHYLK